MFDVNKIRADFPILSTQVNGKPLVYFDNGATSQKGELATFTDKLASLVQHVADAVKSKCPKVSYVDVRTLNQCPTGRCDNRYMDAVKGGGWELTSDVRWRLNKFGVYRCRCGQFLIAKGAT